MFKPIMRGMRWLALLLSSVIIFINKTSPFDREKDFISASTSFLSQKFYKFISLCVSLRSLCPCSFYLNHKDTREYKDFTMYLSLRQPYRSKQSAFSQLLIL
jgi:hypothetical protein